MDSNREINKRISTEVMGWVFDFQFPNCERYLMPDGNFVFTGDDELVIGRLFNPAGDIKDAFEVVEKMRKKGYSFGIQVTPHISSVSHSFSAVFRRSVYPPVMNKVGVSDNYWGTAEDPELAISLSALEAVKGQDNGY